MSDPVDHYDVERMIRDELRPLRAQLERELRELREAIGAERVERQDALEGVYRVIDSRTAHLA